MLTVVFLGSGFLDNIHPEGDYFQTSPFYSGNNFSNQPTLNSIRFYHNVSLFHSIHLDDIRIINRQFHLLCFFQLDLAFLSPFGTPWKSTQIKVAHAFGRAHKVCRSLFLDVELTSTRFQHLSTEKAFSMFHLFHRFFTWWSAF